MATPSIPLALSPVHRSSINSETLPDLFDLALAIINTVPSTADTSTETKKKNEINLKWTLSKTDGTTKLYSSKYEGETWLSRVVRTELPYEAIRHFLTDERVSIETALTGSKDDWCEKVKEEDIGGVWIVQDIRKNVTITGFSPRVFLQTIIHGDRPKSPAGKRCFMVVAVPTEGEVLKGEVRGWYTAVEYVRELEEGGVEYLMALTSNAGGSIPRWVQGLSMPGQLFTGGRRFLEIVGKWVEDRGRDGPGGCE
ncbi:hypothetical protein RUND412_009718 [Rhizina undulata]